jgi:hypothetical protein
MFDLRQLLMGAITLGVIAVATGCGGGAPTVATTTRQPSPAPPPSAGTQLYQGQAFSIAYPAGWWVHDAEQPKRFGTETTILDPADHARMIRIDVAGHPLDLGATRSDRGLLAVRRINFQGRPARHWTYVSRRNGRAIRIEAILFNDRRQQGILIATQAPARDYDGLADFFAGVRASYLAN